MTQQAFDGCQQKRRRDRLQRSPNRPNAQPRAADVELSARPVRLRHAVYRRLHGAAAAGSSVWTRWRRNERIGETEGAETEGVVVHSTIQNARCWHSWRWRCTSSSSSDIPCVWPLLTFHFKAAVRGANFCVFAFGNKAYRNFLYFLASLHSYPLFSRLRMMEVSSWNCIATYLVVSFLNPFF